jgi:hypothetical protein
VASKNTPTPSDDWFTVETGPETKEYEVTFDHFKIGDKVRLLGSTLKNKVGVIVGFGIRVDSLTKDRGSRMYLVAIMGNPVIAYYHKYLEKV